MRFLVVVLLSVLVFISRSALAATAVFPVEGTNLKDGEAEAMGQLFATAYQIEVKGGVIAPKQSQAALAETGGYGPATQKLGASEYVYISAIRLEQRIVITASRYGTQGELIHSVKTTANSLDDLEPVSERLARALARKQSIRETQTIDNVTQTEGKAPNRTFVEKVMGIKAGFTLPVSSEKIAPMMSIGFDGRLEGRSYFLEIGAGFTIPGDSEDKRSYGGLYADLGASFYLANASIAPYLGGGVLPRLMSTNVTNLAVYGQAGVMFMRESSSRFYLDFRVAQNVLPVGFGYEYDSFDDFRGEKDELYPTEFTMSVGMGW